jgi:trigger factor
MEIKSVKNDSANSTVNAVIDANDLSSRVEKIAKDAAKTMSIDGFRKGKVPVKIIKSRYADKLNEDAKNEAVREVFTKAIAELNIAQDSIIGEPNFTKFEDKDGGLDIEMTIATRPEINIDGYKDAVPEVKAMEVSDEEVQKRLEEMASSQAPMVDVEEDRAVVDGDTTIMDFEGSVDGVLFEGGAATDYTLKIGSGSFIPGFEDQMIGIKKGEEKTITVTFPENYGSADLAGKEAQFKVKVNTIQEQGEAKIDDELAKKMNPNDENATVETLKEDIKSQLVNESKMKYYNEELKEVFSKNLVEKFTLDLPNNIVEQEINVKLNQKVREMSEDELNELKENQDKVKAMQEELRPEASDSVKMTFIIDEIAKKEEVDVSDQELMQVIYYEALMSGQNPQETMEYYKQNNILPAIKMSMIEEKLMTKLFDEKAEAK